MNSEYLQSIIKDLTGVAWEEHGRGIRNRTTLVGVEYFDKKYGAKLVGQSVEETIDAVIDVLKQEGVIAEANTGYSPSSMNTLSPSKSPACRNPRMSSRPSSVSFHSFTDPPLIRYMESAASPWLKTVWFFSNLLRDSSLLTVSQASTGAPSNSQTWPKHFGSSATPGPAISAHKHPPAIGLSFRKLRRALAAAMPPASDSVLSARRGNGHPARSALPTMSALCAM